MAETICIVGLGYVGLPLAVAFANHYDVIGFDTKKERILELQDGKDTTTSVQESLLLNPLLTFTANPEELKKASYIIIAVPTPVDDAKHPDLTPLKSASAIIGKHMTKGATVIYESTVYPGVTEEICLPILEKESGMSLKNRDFSLGYSPERINPGDKLHRLDNVIKIVSGHNPETLEKIARLYEKIVTAGVHRAPSIKVAEAAKITENIQRDVNIALMNELSLIYSRLNIDTYDVLAAAGTKWNFHHYTPGLVGGHCIGVDPYYLAYKATEHGYHPKMILSGREINDYMARHLAEMTIKELNNKGIVLKHAKVLLLGLTFKEDVGDMRNSRAKDVVSYLAEYGITMYGCEPNVSQAIVEQQYKIASVSLDALPLCDAVILINKHKQFSSLTLNTLKEKTNCSVLIDVKRFFSKEATQKLDIIYRSL